MLGATNLLTPLSYANAADVQDYDTSGNPIWTGKSFSFIMPAHDVWLYAMTEANNYFVDYHGHGETSWEMSWSMFTYDTTWDLEPNAYVKTWYTFKDWNEDENGNGTGHANEAKVFNWTAEESGHVHIYAQWTANRYSIDYTLNDSGVSPAYHPQTPTWAAYDQPIEIVNPSRTWYTFSGWDITNMGTGASHTVGWQENYEGDTASDVMGTGYKNLRETEGTVHFAARWKADDVGYTVNHFLQKLDDSYDMEHPDETVPFSWIADTNVTGATINPDWFTPPSEENQRVNADGSTVFNYKYSRNSYELELIAGRWVDEVTVNAGHSTWGTNTGSKEYSIKFDDNLGLSFTLKSWYTWGVWSGYSGTASSFNMPAENISKTAYADVITYTIKQYCQWGSGCVESQEYNVESAPINLPTPEGTHSDFLWWTGTDIEDTVESYTIPTGSIWNKEYTAQWKCHTWYHASSAGSGSCIANTDTEFTIEYYYESLTWEYVLSGTQTDHGTTDSGTNVVADPVVWFTAQNVTQQNINWDGSTVVQVKYDRNSYSEDIQDGTWLHTTAVGANDANASGWSWHHQYGDTVTLSYTEEPGYTFDHWVVEGSWFGPITLNGDNNTFTMPASDVTITSVSTTNTYHISIDKNWWEGGTDSGYAYTVESSVTLENPIRDNSVFVWWSWTDLNQTTETVTFSGRAYDSSYEAVWDCDTWYTANPDGQSCDANVYTVTINYNDEDQDNVTTWYVYDQTWTIEIPTKSWYDFAGWTVSWNSNTATADGQPLVSPTSGTEFNNLTTTSGATVTFEANWVAKEDTVYKVYYYTQNVENDNYTLVDSGVHQWTSDTKVAVSDLVYDISWYNTPAVWYLDWWIGGHSGESYTLITIDRHGTTEIYLFYDRGTFNVYLSGDAHVTALSGAGPYKFWDTVNVSAEVATWYHFKQWRRKTNSGFNEDYQNPGS